MSAERETEYLTSKQVAEMMGGVKITTVQQTLWRGLMPEPDMVLFNRNLWLRDTIERWLKNRPGQNPKKRRRRKRKRLHVSRRLESPPRNAKITGATGEFLPLADAVSPERAAQMAGALRSEGHHCTARDVHELAVADPESLSWERRKLQQRVRRKLRH